MSNESQKTAGNTQTPGDYEYNTLMNLLRVSVSKHLLDDHFTLIWANDFYYEMIGWERSAYERKFHNRPDLFYADHQDTWKELCDVVMDAMKEGKNGYRLVSKMPRKDGSTVYVQMCNSFSEEYMDGYQVSYTVMTNVDDLVRVQQEQSVTYNNLPGFIAKFRVEKKSFTFLDGNDKFTAVFDDCANGLAYGLTNYESDINRDAIKQNMPLMQQGVPVHFTLQAKNKSGDDIWLQVNGDCVDWQNDKPVYLVIYIDITDITEQRALQKQLEERSDMLKNALTEAEQANRAKSTFLSRMSHDIRTPMNAIIGMTAIAVSHVDDKDRVLDYLDKIALSSQLLLGLINEVLDMSRIESGRIAMAEEEFGIGDLLHNVIAVVQSSITAKKHRFDIRSCDLRHEAVIGDAQRLQQVFLNLLSNAIKYTPDNGQIILEISELSSDIDGFGRYRFVFQDNGYGMKPEFLNRIFEPFERADDLMIRSIQGTGLGMSISQNIAHMMNGDIKVESEYGKGSKFIVELYLQLQDVEDEKLILPENVSILVVDDDKIACESVCKCIEEIGIKSEYVLSGEKAVRRVVTAHKNKQDFLAAIIDLKMPDVNGIETTRRIRAQLGEDLPIILISAYDFIDYEDEAIAAGVNGFIIKPMLKSNLIYAIKKYVLKEKVQTDKTAISEHQHSFEGKRLLLVEDNEINREIAVELLQITGVQVDTAGNGLEAVERFMNEEVGFYDMVFMDLQMPVMDGLEATRMIRELNRKDSKTVPIVAMTANTFSEDVQASLAAGMNAHISKPINIELLYQIMEQHLYKKKNHSK